MCLLSPFILALLFLVTMALASRPGGLPLGFLTRTTDFPGIKELFDPLLWSTGGRSGRKVWFLIVFSITLALLCNLMG
jgi:hypothetical protein